MRRVLTVILVAAQALSLGWAVSSGPSATSHGALWHVALGHRGTTASQPREIRARSAAMATQNALWPRTAGPRGSEPIRRRAERLKAA